jgi:hypothetical protein
LSKLQRFSQPNGENLTTESLKLKSKQELIDLKSEKDAEIDGLGER